MGALLILPLWAVISAMGALLNLIKWVPSWAVFFSAIVLAQWEPYSFY